MLVKHHKYLHPRTAISITIARQEWISEAKITTHSESLYKCDWGYTATLMTIWTDGLLFSLSSLSMEVSRTINILIHFLLTFLHETTHLHPIQSWYEQHFVHTRIGQALAMLLFVMLQRKTFDSSIHSVSRVKYNTTL